jgi:hypothetical protein
MLQRTTVSAISEGEKRVRVTRLSFLNLLFLLTTGASSLLAAIPLVFVTVCAVLKVEYQIRISLWNFPP